MPPGLPRQRRRGIGETMTTSLKFGTSGLRGLADDLVGREARRYSAAFVSHLRAKGWDGDQILLGRDLRASSPAIAASVIEAMAACGVVVCDAGPVPTPALALAAMERRLPAIMVTGSHIPGDRNGLKFYGPTGEIDKADEEGIARGLGEDVMGKAVAEPVPEVLDAYRKRYDGLLGSEALAGWRVGIWQQSSVARDLLVELIRAAGAGAIPIERSEMFVPVDTEAVGAALQLQIAEWVMRHRLDALVSTDGDADRPLVADETGMVIRGDVLGILTARMLGAHTVVTPVTSNSTIERLVPVVVRTRVGSPYVIAAMAGAEAPVVGFEANGGILLGSAVTFGEATLTALPTRDAVLPILAVLKAARDAGQTLGELVARLPPRFARSDRLENVSVERSAALFARLHEDAAEFLRPQGRIERRSEIDGLRYELASGDVIHYRPSGNAPELRCYVEASNSARADELLHWGLAAAETVVR
jgi:phosphomannomutase